MIAFTQKPQILSNKNTFSRIGARLWSEIPRSLRELSKTYFNAGIKMELRSMRTKNSFLEMHEIIHQQKPFNVFSQ